LIHEEDALSQESSIQIVKNVNVHDVFNSDAKPIIKSGTLMASAAKTVQSKPHESFSNAMQIYSSTQQSRDPVQPHSADVVLTVNRDNRLANPVVIEPSKASSIDTSVQPDKSSFFKDLTLTEQDLPKISSPKGINKTMVKEPKTATLRVSNASPKFADIQKDVISNDSAPQAHHDKLTPE